MPYELFSIDTINRDGIIRVKYRLLYWRKFGQCQKQMNPIPDSEIDLTCIQNGVYGGCEIKSA